MKAISFIKKNILPVIAVVTVISFSSFKLWDKATQSTVTFIYTPASGDTPFEQSSVEEPSNWNPGSPCSESEDQDKACSITVPLTNTMNSGQELDPSKVTLQSEEYESSGSYRIVDNPSGGYSNPINQPLN
ncbi:hypothetical protein [Sphingobacterium gobiense]|uniref:Uncharacterized protein n=1 Tax=Sphingobacterium gobiense TaxID=1382456 RepID=A0A2S9JUS5_9SPHI|nr:hypothetical protein [Sphingobacterium gobiense]PRD57036.1 hypothetical protein C5749_07460 [Sphingobacterium gobiense]